MGTPGQSPLDEQATNWPCPACGFLTVPEQTYGTFNICGICGWEDDNLQFGNPASGGGANSESLIEAQRAALREYPLTVLEEADIKRDPAWRPLSEKEIAAAESAQKEEHWKDKSVYKLSDAYWNKP